MRSFTEKMAYDALYDGGSAFRLEWFPNDVSILNPKSLEKK